MYSAKLELEFKQASQIEVELFRSNLIHFTAIYRVYKAHVFVFILGGYYKTYFLHPFNRYFDLSLSLLMMIPTLEIGFM